MGLVESVQPTCPSRVNRCRENGRRASRLMRTCPAPSLTTTVWEPSLWPESPTVTRGSESPDRNTPTPWDAPGRTRDDAFMAALRSQNTSDHLRGLNKTGRAAAIRRRGRSNAQAPTGASLCYAPDLAAAPQRNAPVVGTAPSSLGALHVADLFGRCLPRRTAGQRQSRQRSATGYRIRQPRRKPDLQEADCPRPPSGALHLRLLRHAVGRHPVQHCGTEQGGTPSSAVASCASLTQQAKDACGVAAAPQVTRCRGGRGPRPLTTSPVSPGHNTRHNLQSASRR